MSFAILVGQCAAMFFASILVGSLPLLFKAGIGSRGLSGVSVLGMGILIGAALTIIIPEGVETLYASSKHSETHTIGMSLLAGFALMFLVENITPHPPHDHEDCEEERAEYRAAIAEDRVPMLPKPDAEHDHKCASHAAAHGLSATLGLVIHGAADGIAIGASSLSGSAQLGLVVFLAVLVHKGPAALGLTTTLLNLHLSPSQVRRRLVIFSLSAPLGALLTYAFVLLFGKGSSTNGHDRLGWWTGVVLLFSGGSFLYVATVIQPISQTGPDDHCHDIHHEVHKREEPPPLPYGMRTGLILGGMLLPLLLSLLVGSHDHGA